MQQLIVIGLLVSILLLVFNRKHDRSSVCLGCFFFLLTSYCGSEYLFFHLHPVLLTAIAYNYLSFLHYLIGPLLYWYVSRNHCRSLHFRKSDAFHLLPALGCLVTMLIVGFTNGSIHNDFFCSLDGNELLEHPCLATVNNNSIFVVAIYALKPFFILAYALYAFIGLLRRLPHQLKVPAIFTLGNTIVWLLMLLLFTILWSSAHCFGVYTVVAGINNVLSHRLSCLLLLMVLLVPFFFPGILYNQVYTDVKNRSAFNRPEKTKIQHFTNEYFEQIEQKCNAVMQNDCLFLIHNCNLTDLAHAIEVPQYHLTCYFREFRHEAFNDYRNKLRVEYVRQLLISGEASGFTLEAIGKAAGFQSKSTFFTAFKKIEGTTPRDFLKNHVVPVHGHAER